MKKEFEDKLVNDFPSLYKKSNEDGSIMSFGFECKDGWYDLIYVLSLKISTESKRAEIDVSAAQVKEKFGTLRFYVDGGNERIHQLITEAEIASSHICESCGLEGKLRGKWWVTTLCDSCTENREIKS